jgi:hypothetical protein
MRTLIRTGLGLAAAFLAGCASYTALSPEDLSRLGTRQYARCTVTQASDGAATAFKTLGYEISRLDSASGVVKTAPKAIFVESRATAKHYKTLGPDETKATMTVQRDTLAWVARSVADGDGVTIVMTPRAYRNGVEKTGPGTFVKEVMDPHYQQVWRELQDELHACR